MSSVNQVRSFQNQIISFHFNTHPLINKRFTTFIVAFSRSGREAYTSKVAGLESHDNDVVKMVSGRKQRG